MVKKELGFIRKCKQSLEAGPALISPYIKQLFSAKGKINFIQPK